MIERFPQSFPGPAHRFPERFGHSPISSASVELWIQVGQSNTGSKGNVTLVTVESGLGNPYAAVSEVTHADGTGFEDPLVWADTGPRSLQSTGGNAFSFELTFARRLTEAGRKVAILKVWVDSTSLAVHWPFNAAAPSPKNLAQQFMDYVAAEVVRLTATGVAVTIGGFIWCQCEGDADNVTEANNYDDNMVTFWTTVRATYPGALLMFYRLHSSCSQAFTTEMRASQVNYVKLDKLSRMINVDDLTLLSESGGTVFLHFDSDSYALGGNRFATHALGTAVLNSLAVTPDSQSFDIAAGTQQFTAMGIYESGTGSQRNLTDLVTWDTDNHAVATINAAGVLTPVGAGSCNVTATLGAISDSAPVTITAAAAAPTIVGWGALAHGTTNQSAAFPAGYAAGDQAYLYTESTVSLAAPTGWTQKATRNVGANFHQVFECNTRTGAEGAPTVAIGTSNHLAARILAIRGANATAIDDIQTGDSGGTGVTAVTFPLVTTTGLNRLIVGSMAWSIDDAGPLISGYTNSNLASVVEQVDAGTTDGNGGGIAAFSGTKSSTGSTGTTTATSSQSILWEAITIAFKP